MSEFHFLRPWWLAALVLLAFLSWRLLRRERSDGDWIALCDPGLLSHLLITRDAAPTRHRLGIGFAVSGLLAILALAGPTWERLPSPAFRNESALVIALDLSRSMDAADIKPSRLERARFKIEDLLNRRRDGLTALLVYSGEAYTVTPLTEDTETIRAQLSALSSALMPTQGSRTDLALTHAEDLLKQAGLPRGDVLLITSGVNLGKTSPVAEKLRGEGYRLSVLGAGSDQGAPIPLPEGGFLQDTKGTLVISKQATPALRQLASEGGGIYRNLAADDTDLSMLLSYFGETAQSNAMQAKGELLLESWEETGPWLLLPLLPLAALAFRRGILAGILWLLLLPNPDPAFALEWRDLWRTPDQQAQKAFDQGRTEQAAETFADPNWKATAQYKAGQYQEAAKTLEPLDDPDARYNRGNALAKAGALEEALKAYQQALAKAPQHEDARHNMELVKQALKEKQKQEKKERDSSKQGDQGQQEDAGKKDSDQQSAETKNTKNTQQADQKEAQDAGQNDTDKSASESSAKDRANASPEPGQPASAKQDPPTEQKNMERNETAQPLERAEQDRPEEREGQDTTLEHQKESQQASEQWLRRIPDDPGGLLKRKFYYQYQQRQGR